MKRRIALAAATIAAAVALPLTATTSAQASAWHFQGAYPSAAACDEAGKAGVLLWGPLFVCSPGGQGWYNLYVH
ncbi:hypothetical protein [Streptomyces sp. NPDC004042]|uniref:hypothetical protein n=1 Tax=Streptomyces sp. NPDC004042 TaxID=3154451 RepID=UPI0033B8B948